MSDGPAAADHLSLDQLAELEEGIADDGDALRRHLDHCTVCRRRTGQLRASRALLSALPPEPMPAEVAARVDAALAAEPAPARGFVPGGDIVPMRGRRAWWRGPNVAAVAAGIAVLALGAALVVGHAGGNSTGQNAAKAPDSANRPAAGVTSGLKQWQTGQNYTRATLPGLVTGIVLETPPPLPAASPLSQPAGAGPASSTPAPSPAPPGATPKESYSRDQLRVPATVFACAKVLAGRPVQPLAVDYAQFDGVPAVILVLPDLEHPSAKLDVYVIRTACSDAASDIGFFAITRPTG